MNKGKMTTKDRHRLKLLEYLGNPDLDFPTRCAMSAEVLGFACRTQIYSVFTPSEITEIEQEGLELRRQQYSKIMSKVDKSLLHKAARGDVQAAKLAYQRFEHWSEKQRIEADITADVAMGITVTFEGTE